MAQDEKNWHPNFLNYMATLIHHPHYKGLPIKQKPDGTYAWIATAQSQVGKQRIEWCIQKAQALKLITDAKPYPGMYADVMLHIHPTKSKVCQICGNSMSLYYVYPNALFLKSLNETFSSHYSDCDAIFDIWDDLIKHGVTQTALTRFLIHKGGLSLDPFHCSKKEVLQALEYACRKGNKKCLGPGAMSNFPDRYDGFHTYNRCCRASEDTGRFKKNLKSYTKDRRAYEYWSDGNIHAANQFMGSSFFENHSADHIGPISLGFVHDPRYLQPMLGSDNSSKRDRLQVIDIEHLLEIEQRTHICPISWYSKLLWEHIKLHYQTSSKKVPTLYRKALKQNMTNFMYILFTILETCPHEGTNFLVDAFLKPNFDSFKYTYTFNARGDILTQTPRHYTARNAHETDRYVRIAITSISDYNHKNNRQNKPDLQPDELHLLQFLCEGIENQQDTPFNKNVMMQLMKCIQKRLISAL